MNRKIFNHKIAANYKMERINTKKVKEKLSKMKYLFTITNILTFKRLTSSVLFEKIFLFFF